jgi:hypothetical protein
MPTPTWRNVHAVHALLAVHAVANHWLNGGFKGVDFGGNLEDPNIDFATIRSYPDK